MFKKFLQSIGIVSVPNKSEPQNLTYNTSTDPNKVKVHMEYLNSLRDEEQRRLELIESKTAQLISQTGIIFSLLGIFIPFLLDKVTDLDFYFRITLIVLVLLSFAFYMLTIINALKNFNVAKFKYSSPAPKNVVTFRNKNLGLFYKEIVNDILFSLEKNNEINNTKATNLLQSYNSFRYGNILMAVLVIFLCFSILIIKPKQINYQVNGNFEINNFDSLLKVIKNASSGTRDTFQIHICPPTNN